MINNSLSERVDDDERKVHEMQDTQTENFVQVNVSQKEFLCHSCRTVNLFKLFL